MSAEERGDDRIAQLERRVATLEGLVRELAARARLWPETAASRRPPGARPMPVASSAPPEPRPAPPSPATVAPPSHRAAPDWDLEQWFGARGLLLVGVIALLAAAGFFLNYAFERGWIPPFVRVMGALGAGVIVALAGERQVLVGLRRFGLGLIGAGGGLVYLGIWAAAGPYAMIGRQAGVLLIAAATAVFAWRAVHHHAEALALWTLLGAFLAPILLPAPDARPELLLAYLVVVGDAAAVMAIRREWRITLNFAVIGYFGLAVALVPATLSTPAGLGYVALGSAATLVAWRRTRWEEVRLSGFLLGWILLAVYGTRTGEPGIQWSAFVLGSLLLVAEWLHALSVAELRDPELRIRNTLEAATFSAAPVAFAVLALVLDPPGLHSRPGLAPAAAALLYLAGGWRDRRAAFVAVGFGLLAIASARQFDGPAVIVTWCGLMLVAQGAERWMSQRAGAGVALVLAVVAGTTLFSITRFDRQNLDPAFAGTWSLALYTYLGATAGTALWWSPRREMPDWLESGRAILWSLVGLAVFAGGSLELHRHFDARVDVWPAARLAGDLAISVFWLLFAGATLALGFQRNHAAIRGTGLVVAGLAAAKIALYDLGRLEALFRVGSFFVLALLALAVAYAYNRKARSVEPGH
jgi:uncharacterized membrane protein